MLRDCPTADAAKDCVRRMLVREPKRRATAQQIMQHEWMRENGCAADQPIQLEVLSRIKQFSAMNRLKKEALKVCVCVGLAQARVHSRLTQA